MSVTVFTRQPNSKTWLNDDFEKEEDEIFIEEFSIRLKDIYEQIEFSE